MPDRIGIICAGLSCLDLQLLGCTKSSQAEAIEQYEKAVYCAGGSASMAATTLALLCSHDSEVKSPYDIFVLTRLGKDLNGQVMLDFYREAGAKTELCSQDPSVATAMSVLPVFKAGGRACFFNLAANNSFTKDHLLTQLKNLPKDVNTAAFLFGYPHLLPQMQGETLKAMLIDVRKRLGQTNDTSTSSSLLVGVDLNGVSVDNHRPDLLGPALEQVDVLHLNEEEAELLSGIQKDDLLQQSGEALKIVADALHRQGCAVVLLSLGSKGSYISVTSDSARLSKCPAIIRDSWKASSSVRIPAFAIAAGDVNANGAGDALFSGFCFAAANMDGASLQEVGTFAALVARQRCDVKTRDTPEHSAAKIMQIVRSGVLPPAIP